MNLTIPLFIVLLSLSVLGLLDNFRNIKVVFLIAAWIIFILLVLFVGFF